MSALSLRERNKQDKRHRIKVAAEQLFTEKGFDSATTRGIADQAQVALSTLFLYATDKRDLLFLACNDGLEKTTLDAIADVSSDAPLIDQFTVFFRHVYIHFGRNKRLSRDFLRELTFYKTGKNNARYLQIRERTISQIRKLVRNAKQSGEIAATLDDAVVAQMIFFLVAADLRRWLGDEDSTPENGVQYLRKMLEILFTGLSP